MKSAAARRTTHSLAAVVAAAALAGCSAGADTHSGLTEDEARAEASALAAEERADSASDLYRVALTVGRLEARTTSSGDEHWYAVLVDGQGTARVCARIRGGFSAGVGVRRCDPDGAPAPLP